jgi:hypothetical protein
MNRFRTFLEVEEGVFLVDAIHEENKVKTLSVYPIENGSIQSCLPYTEEDFPDVVNRIQDCLMQLE